MSINQPTRILLEAVVLECSNKLGQAKRMSKITIKDLEVFYCVGVPDEERAKPQRLLLTDRYHLDFSVAAVSDRIQKTIDYYAVAQTLAEITVKAAVGNSLKNFRSNLADLILNEYQTTSGDGGGEEVCDSSGAVCLGYLDAKSSCSAIA